MTTDSYISHSPHATVFSGPDATLFLQAITLRQALRLYAKYRIKLARSCTPTQMLTMAGKFTGKVYPRGSYALAAEELSPWIDTMRAALPHVTPDQDTAA
jgi:hypothetical protein